MTERLRQAAARMGGEPTTGSVNGSAYTLQKEQVGVLADFTQYLRDAIHRTEEDAPAYGRFIQPPRTGKTVVAGQIIMASRLTSTFIVPTRALVDQTARELRKQLPDVPIGTYSGEAKETVGHGINVATYQILQKTWKESGLPAAIASSALIFADEGHVAMTEHRQEMLKAGFDPRALRIAMTATPDYDNDRVLSRYFPELIHEITLAEAVELELFAPVRMWVAEVDEDASHVRLIAGNYDDERLGRLMSGGPYFAAAERFRYEPENRRLGALVCCASRQQAYDLQKYLAVHRPEGSPPPALVLGETSGRKDILDGFEHGKLDTIVNVGVLLTGWNSPRCKLLIDLAPSVSRVRAMQKFFRPLTRQGDEEARIYQIIPRKLAAPPIMPIELFGLSQHVYEAGALIGKSPTGKPSPPAETDRYRKSPIMGVELKSRILLTSSVERPELDPRDEDGIRRVLNSSDEFVPGHVWNFSRFRWLLFRHSLYTGRGEQLLRYLGYPATAEAYRRLMVKLFPEESGTRILERYENWTEEACDDERSRVLLAFSEPTLRGKPTAAALEAWTMLTGGEPIPDPEEAAIARSERAFMETCLERLPPLDRACVRQYCGFDQKEDGTPSTLDDIGRPLGLSRERIRQVILRGGRKVKEEMELCEERATFIRLGHAANTSVRIVCFAGPHDAPIAHAEPVGVRNDPPVSEGGWTIRKVMDLSDERYGEIHSITNGPEPLIVWMTWEDRRTLPTSWHVQTLKRRYGPFQGSPQAGWVGSKPWIAYADGTARFLAIGDRRYGPFGDYPGAGVLQGKDGPCYQARSSQALNVIVERKLTLHAEGGAIVPGLFTVDESGAPVYVVRAKGVDLVLRGTEIVAGPWQRVKKLLIAQGKLVIEEMDEAGCRVRWGERTFPGNPKATLIGICDGEPLYQEGALLTLGGATLTQRCLGVAKVWNGQPSYLRKETGTERIVASLGDRVASCDGHASWETILYGWIKGRPVYLDVDAPSGRDRRMKVGGEASPWYDVLSDAEITENTARFYGAVGKAVFHVEYRVP